MILENIEDGVMKHNMVKNKIINIYLNKCTTTILAKALEYNKMTTHQKRIKIIADERPSYMFYVMTFLYSSFC